MCITEYEKIIKDFDDKLFLHSLSVSNIAVLYASMYSKDSVSELRLSGILHDIGKIYIPYDILHKPSSLTNYELYIVRKHPVYGYNIVKNDVDIPDSVKACILEHQEKSDGTGYPNELNNDKITDISKIIHISDVYSALKEKRSYKPSFDDEKIKNILIDSKNTFDPVVFDNFCNLFFK